MSGRFSSGRFEVGFADYSTYSLVHRLFDSKSSLGLRQGLSDWRESVLSIACVVRGPHAETLDVQRAMSSSRLVHHGNFVNWIPDHFLPLSCRFIPPLRHEWTNPALQPPARGIALLNTSGKDA